ncbi:hypothetical protein Nepgr_014255 [Nepenthes gracilis]|uniref:Protein cereblon n=1 Tax=Nepenthes gracilis TaxID=150966 RepID=A0AAD3SKK9_NEPGR|nr:hypothetical protein Nepgr_014255 [Nepenthes gracilis]
MDEDRIMESERHQIEQIRELDLEELQVEEVENLHGSSDDDTSGRAYRDEFTFDAGLASLHTYLGEVEDTHHRLSFLDSGAILNLPLFYLEGVVLFPEATLPLRVIQPNLIRSVERAMSLVDVPYTIGVVRIYRDSFDGRLRFASVGTTAEIRQYRRLEDGSMNVVTRGLQRFRVRRRWIDVDGAPCGEIQIIQEDLPLRIPRDAFGTLPPLTSVSSPGPSHPTMSNTSHIKRQKCREGKNDFDADSEDSFESELSLKEMRLHQSAVESCYGCDTIDESTSSDDEKNVFESGGSQDSVTVGRSSQSNYQRNTSDALGVGRKAISQQSSHKQEKTRMDWIIMRQTRSHGVPRAFWPFWVYRMHDSYCLARKAADMWKTIVRAPSMDGFTRKPDILSFYIASKIPVSESTRQELLEIDGISYRLRREIELLENFDRVRCKNCQTVIARRSDMLVMSSEGPLGAYVNPYGYVHEIMTLYKANGLALIGHPVDEYSWFPGYAWTIANCATCERQMGWLFTATNKKLKPKYFWGIRCSQVADDMR